MIVGMILGVWALYGLCFVVGMIREMKADLLVVVLLIALFSLAAAGLAFAIQQ